MVRGEESRLTSTRNVASAALVAKAGLCALAIWLAWRQAVGVAGQPDVGLLSFGFFLIAILAGIGLLLYVASAGLIRVRNRGARVLAGVIDIAATVAFIGLLIWLAMFTVQPDGSIDPSVGPWPLALALIFSLALVAGSVAVVRAVGRR